MRTKLLSIKSLLMLCMMCVLGGMSAVAQETLASMSVSEALGKGWTTDAATAQTGQKKAYKMVPNAIMSSPSIDFSQYGKLVIDIKAGTFGTISKKQADVQVDFVDEENNVTEVTTFSVPKGLQTGKDFSYTGSAPKSKGILRFSCPNAETNNCGKIFSITISGIVTGTFTITSAGYATYFTDKAFVMPEGVTGYTITEKNGENLTMNAAYEAGATVPASTGLVLKGEAKDYTYNVTTTEVTAPEDNLLHGSVKAATTNVEGAVAYYKLADGDNSIGFYYGAENGAAFENGANKAYLAVKSANSQKQSFSFSELDNTVTAINTAKANATKTTSIYDINGRRLNTLNGAAKGLYIVNGQKVMVK